MVHRCEVTMNRRLTFMGFLGMLAGSLLLLNACDVTGSDRPEILSIRPSDGSVDVARNSNIVITFSEPMDPTSCENRFKLVMGEWSEIPGIEERIPGHFIWDNFSQTMTFDPDSLMDTNMPYSICLEEGMEAHHDGHFMNMMGMRNHGREVESGIISIFFTE